MNYLECEQVLDANRKKGITKLSIKDGSKEFLKIKSNGLLNHLCDYYPIEFSPNVYIMVWGIKKMKPKI